MSNSKIALGTSSEKDNKTAYERFEESIRFTTFNVLYVLLKNEENSKWDFTFNIVADMIQTYSFTFSQNVRPSLLIF